MKILHRKVFQIRDLEFFRYELIRVCSSSYLDPEVVVDRALSISSDVYELRDDTNTLLSFFFVKWDPELLLGFNYQVAYLGLSVSDQRYKNTGLINQLYEQFVLEASILERDRNKKVLLWATTASPSVVKAFYSLFHSVQPHLDGNYSQQSLSVIFQIRELVGQLSFEHPFVVRNLEYAADYTDIEVERIEYIIQTYNVELLTRLEINHRNRDRLILFGFLSPSPIH